MRFMLYVGACLALVLTATLCSAQDASSSAAAQADGAYGQQALDRLEQAGDNRSELAEALESAPTPKQREAVAFLIAFMPERDLKSLTAEYLLDNVALAFKAREIFPWAKDVPWDIFLNDVLPYATLNERRDDWRRDFFDRFAPIVAECKTAEEAYKAIAGQIQRITEVKYSTKRKKPDQSPYESMEIGMASCTGLSILCTDAMRAVGVPTRIAGTPEWTTVEGNHNWCEVYIDGEWKFTEYGSAGLNHAWFLGRAARADASDPRHRIYASTFRPAEHHFPLVWAPDVRYVAAVDVTQRYKDVQAERKQEQEAKLAEVSVVLYEQPGGERIIREVRVSNATKVIASGMTRGPSDDLNNMLSFKLKPQSSFTLEYDGADGDPVQHTLATGEAGSHERRMFYLSGAGGSKKNGISEDLTVVAWLESLDEDVEIPWDLVAEMKRRIWAKYSSEQRADPQRIKEHTDKSIDIGENTMRYESFTIGERPENGYPLYIALHGGGGAPPRVNDSQWNHMKAYYRDSVAAGVYVAPRGMTNTYNLHSVGPSYPAYDRLIENMILFEDVDPNRVYVLGFSAGGDGVYQIAPRMADRWAAVNMSAGHPNGVSLLNVLNVPFLLQVGANDSAYNRNSVAAQYGIRLDALKTQHPEGFVHEVNIHKGRPHNFRDNDAAMADYEVMADPAAWLNEKDETAVARNTNAIAWMDRHARNPAPEKVIWELKVGAGGRSNADLFATPNRGYLRYWLDLSGRDLGKTGSDVVIARLDRANNAVIVEQCGDTLTILLNSSMLDLERPIRIDIEDASLQFTPRASLKTMLQTLIDRGDPEFIFEASVTLTKEDGGWVVR